VKLQVEKWLFSCLHPLRGPERAGTIRQLSLRVTDICNLRCETCGQWGRNGFLLGKNMKELKREEVSFARYREVLADLVSHGHHPLVYLWGGEPMLYEGSLALMAAATALGLPASVATNGTKIASVARELVRLPLFLLQISVDGHCADLHNSIRPAVAGENNFAQIESAMRAVHEEKLSHGRRLPLVVPLTTISKRNYRFLVDIYDRFRDLADFFVFYLSWWITPERAAQHDREFARRFGFKPKLHWGWVGNWTPDDYRVLNRQLQELSRRARSRRSPPVMLMPNVTGETDLETYYTDHSCLFGYSQCVSICQAVEVNSNGDVSPCRDYHDYVVGNIKTATISELWNCRAYREFRRSLATDGLMPACSRCCGLMGY